MVVPWEFLKEPVDLIGQFVMPVNVLFFIVAGLLFAISFLAWKKKGSKKLLVVSAAFGVFFLKSVLMILDYYLSPGYFMNYAIQGFFDLIVLVLLFLAVLKN
jgi:riboflavin transporter FmnP